jgi:hypothetical protein
MVVGVAAYVASVRGGDLSCTMYVKRDTRFMFTIQGMKNREICSDSKGLIRDDTVEPLVHDK